VSVGGGGSFKPRGGSVNGGGGVSDIDDGNGRSQRRRRQLWRQRQRRRPLAAADLCLISEVLDGPPQPSSWLGTRGKNR